VAKVGTSKAEGTISQQAAVHPWLAADAHGNKKQQTTLRSNLRYVVKRFHTAHLVFFDLTSLLISGAGHQFSLLTLSVQIFSSEIDSRIHFFKWEVTKKSGVF
jgi:hypothetical protein